MKAVIKRKEFAPLMVQMKTLTGLTLRSALTFGKDIRTLQAEVDTLPDFEKTKPERLVELQNQFETLTNEADKHTSEQELLNDWEHSKEFIQLHDEYRKSEHDFMNEGVNFNFKTTFVEKDLKLETISANTGWMLSYFVK